MAEGELALAEGEYRLLENGSKPAEPPAKPRDPDRPESKPSPSPESQALARARLARDLARDHREGVRRTRTRKQAELKKEVERTRGDPGSSKRPSTRSAADLARLERQLKAAALSADEKRAMALLQDEAAGKDPSPSPLRIDRASALWEQAEARRAEATRMDARDRVRKALEEPPSP